MTPFYYDGWLVRGQDIDAMRCWLRVSGRPGYSAERVRKMDAISVLDSIKAEYAQGGNGFRVWLQDNAATEKVV